jgi:tryptophanyl-tRNA synthetase
MESMLKFDNKYYQQIMKKYNYTPVNFKFSNISEENMKNLWLCHNNADQFESSYEEGKKCIISFGIRINAEPHIGTISQILKVILLQKSGFKVQIVLADVGSVNERKDIKSENVQKLVDKYIDFILKLGFDNTNGILRKQSEHDEILKTAYNISSCLRDNDFIEEDIMEFYHKKGVYLGMEFPIKLAISMAVADFVHLGKVDGYDNILFISGIDEHLYVKLIEKVIKRMDYNFAISGIYSKLICGLNNNPKMSKSLISSSIKAGMSHDKIFDIIVNQEPDYILSDDSIVYQMMCAVSQYSSKELNLLSEICSRRNVLWRNAKIEYAEYIMKICDKWRR